MKRGSGVPAMLVETALEGLAHQLRNLRRDGANPRDYVGVYLDGRVAPGRARAIAETRKQGVTLAEANALVDAAIKSARKQGRIFSVGFVLPVEECLRLFRTIGGQQRGVDEVESWLREPLPDRMFRLAIVAGPVTQLQLVPLAE